MVFAAVGVSVFVLALAGLVFLRVYDDQLIRQTESELISQGAVIAEAYRLALVTEVNPATYGRTRTAAWPHPFEPDSELRPILPSLHASAVVRPQVVDPPRAEVPAEAHARAAGARVAALLTAARSTTLAGIRIVDVQGVIVASSGGGLGGSLSNREEIQRALTGAPTSLLRARHSDSAEAPLASISRNSGIRVTVALPVLEGERVFGAVVLSRTPMTLAKAVYGDRWYLTATVLVLLVAVLLTSLAAAALIVRPVRQLVQQTRAMAAQAPEGFEPLKQPIIEELAELSTSLAATARTLRDRNDYIRSFAANVSHEFKTPLAGIRGAVELLRDNASTMSVEQRDRFLANVEADAERLTRLVQRLLELARADAMTAPPASTRLAPVLEAIARRAPEAELSIDGAANFPDAEVTTPREVLEDVLWQLVVNARQHGSAERLRIDVTSTSTPAAGGTVRIRLTDDGKGISEANRARIFDPFFTTARDAGGTGLGLTIARAMLRSFGASLDVESEPSGAGATFVVSVPSAELALQRK